MGKLDFFILIENRQREIKLNGIIILFNKIMRIFIKKEGIHNQRKEDSFFSRENGRMHEKRTGHSAGRNP